MYLIYLVLPIFAHSQICEEEYFDFENPDWTTYTKDSISKEESDFVSELKPNHITNTNGHMLLSMSLDPKRKNFKDGKFGLGAILSTTKLIQYGKITANIKVGSTGKGVVSIFKFETRNAEVISFSITGKSKTSIYTNYQTSRRQDLGNSVEIDLGIDLTENWHEYTIDWQASRLKFLVDGEAVRSVEEKEIGVDYPKTPSYVKFEIIDYGGLNQKYANWAGFPTSYKKGTNYTMDIDSLEIECYNENNNDDDDEE